MKRISILVFLSLLVIPSYAQRKPLKKRSPKLRRPKLRRKRSLQPKLRMAES